MVRRRGRGFRAGALAALVVMLVASFVVVPTPKTADAALSNLFPADVDGFPKGRFYSDEALYVTMVSDFYGGVVCIVDAAITNPASADCVKDVAWGKPRTFTGLGTMLGYPLSAPWLTAGEWRLLTVPALKAKDAFGNEKPVLGTELSEVFVVEACGPCDRSWADDELQPWKDMAGSMKSLKTLTEAAEAYDAASKVYGIAKNMYVGAGFGLSGMVFGGLVGGAGLALDSMGVKSTESMAKDLFKGLANRVGTMYADIAADPPRFDYDVATVPQFETVDQLLPDASMTAAEVALANSYFDAMSHAAAYGDASRLANERYQGAVIDGDHEAAYEQALATSTFTFKLNQQLRLVQLYEAQIIDQSWAVENNVTLPGGETWADVLAEIDLLRTDGLTPAQQAALDAELASCTIKTLADECLITQALVDQALASWQDPAWFASLQAVDPNGSLADVLASNSAKLDDVIAAFDHFGQWMAHNASFERDQIPGTSANRAPQSAFEATALTGTAPLTVTFTSQATDPDGDTMDLTWDIAGTRRVDNETSVTHTFTTPGSYGISLVATDPDGEWDQAIKWISVYPDTGVPDPGNQAPVASFSPQWVDKIGPFTQTFTASSFDPDGDTLTHTWYFGDGTTETGNSVTKTFPPGFVMSVLLVANDGTLTGQVAGEVTSRHPGVDPTPNEPPVVGFDADPASGNSPLQVSFASTSTDPEGDTLTHTWYFGDGNSATGADATHTYTDPGTYTATLVVSDGVNSASTTRQIIVHAVTPITAAFAVARGGDVAAATNGGRILDTGTSTWPGYPVTNLILGTSHYWASANAVTSPQEITIDLAGRGRDLVDRIVLRGTNTSQSVKTFSVALVQGSDPAGTSTTVIDHATLDRTAEYQTFTFAPQRARFVKLTVHDNHGGYYLRLTNVSIPAVGGDVGTGGIVSLAAGNPASIVSATSEYNAGWTAANILNSGTSQWSSAVDATTDQRIRVRLGGEGAHELTTIALRSSGNAYTVGDFEVYASLSGDNGSWTKVLDDTMAPTNAAQSFTLATPTEASYLELRLNGTGAGRYLYLAELRAVTTHGLNVADGNGVGAEVVDSSSNYPGYFPESAIAPDTDNHVWLTERGQSTDQFLTVLLRNGDVATVDRVSVRSSTARPRHVKIQTSLDGVSFTTVAVRELSNATSDEQFISFPPTQARFVKLVLDDGYSTAYIRLDKFRVFSPDRGAADNVPFVDLSTGTEPPVSWLWNFGDGSTSTEQHPTHSFPGPGTYSVTLAVTDDDGNTATVTHPYFVPGVPSTSMTATVATEESDGTFTVDEGTSTSLTASSDDAGIVAWDWDLDYTKPTTTAATTSARFPDQGTYTVRHRGLTADWLWTPWQERTFIVHNLPPTVNAGAAQSGQALDPITPIVATASDPAGSADPLTCTWDWGDGTATDTVTDCNRRSARVPHAYAAAGTYTATLTVDDGDGGVTTDTVEMTVRHRHMIIQITETTPSGSNRTATLRVLDATTGAPVPGRPVQVSADGSSPVTGPTDTDGFVTVTIPGASGAEQLSADVAGTTVYAPRTLTRPVRAPKADIVFLVDESGSMSGAQDTVIAHIQTIVDGLGSSLDYRVGTVGYAAGSSRGFGHVYGPLTNDVPDIYAGLTKLIISSASANGYEAAVVGSGYRFVDGALVEDNEIGLRPNAASCAVLVSDAGVSEANTLINSASQSVPKADYAAALEALQRRGTAFFSISAADQATKDAYGMGPGLAGVTGGANWDIRDFLDDPSGVLDALATKCITKAKTPDLAATIEGPATPVAPGDEVTYTVTASNEAAIDVPAVALTATLPVGVDYLYSAGGGTYEPATRTVTWPSFDLAAGENLQRDVTVQVRADEWDAGDHPLVAGASVSSDGSLGAESDAANNTGNHTLTVHVDTPIGPSTVPATTLSPSTVPPGTTVVAPTFVPPTDPPPTSVIPTTGPVTTDPPTTTAASTTTMPDAPTTMVPVDVGPQVTQVPPTTPGTPLAPALPSVTTPPPASAGVPAPQPAPDDELPRTGPDVPIAGAGLLGLLLSLLGAALIAATRRRRMHR